MPTRLHALVFDAADPPALARFWAAVTGWAVTGAGPDAVVVGPAGVPAGPTGPGLPLAFVPDRGPKLAKNRLHVDLNSTSPSHHAAVVRLAERAGASPADIGQGEVPWVVLADPEGNELCALDPRPEYGEAGPIAAVVLDAPDPVALAPFWAAATGWAVEPQPHDDIRLVPPGGRGPRLELLVSADPKVGRNRLRPALAPAPGADRDAELERLRALGATDLDTDLGADLDTGVGADLGTFLDSGRGRRPPAALADPAGNELCLLDPSGDPGV